MYNCVVLICFLISVGQIRSEVSDLARDEQSVSVNEIMKHSKIVDDKFGFSINESSIPTVRQGRETLRNMCIQNAGGESYNKAEKALNNLHHCFDGIIKFSELPRQVEEAKSNSSGQLDSIFKDYCQHTDDLKGCIVKFLVDIEPCLAENQKSSKYTIQNITEALLKFACEDEGDHIALFISEKGPECIISKQKGIEECIRSHINDTKTNETVDQWLSVAKTDSPIKVRSEIEKPLDQCKTFYNIRKCIILELSTCDSSTPANVVESIFNLVQNSTCSKFTQEVLHPDNNSASMFTSRSMFSITIPAFIILLVSYFS